MITFNQVTKVYGHVKALDQFSLSIEKGEILGFIGHNGAGKTTTLKILSTLMKQDSGTVTIDGKSIWHDPQETRQLIGYMPDFFGVYEDMTVEEYLHYYGELFKISKTERDEIIPKLLELIQLEDKINAPVNGLSRGMKQRLCLGRTLINDPKILLLDEPASGMDPVARIQLKEIIRKLAAAGKTIIISSHILSDIAEICTDICIIDKGTLKFKGKIDEITNQGQHQCKKVKFNYLNLDQEVDRVLSQQPEIVGYKTDEGAAEFTFNEKAITKSIEITSYELLQTLLQSGIRVYAYKMDESTLEEKYLNILNEYGEVGHVSR